MIILLNNYGMFFYVYSEAYFEKCYTQKTYQQPYRKHT